MTSADPPLVQLPPVCARAAFIARIKRFSVLCQLDGKDIWAHSNNTGAMLGLLRPGCSVLLSHAQNPARKLPWTLERVCLGNEENSHWCGVNTQLPNKLLEAAFHAGKLPFASDYDQLCLEKRRGASRLDAFLTGAGHPPLWVECKSVTLVEDGVAAFPDARSERARKHLYELMDIVAAGGRAAMFYLTQRPDAECFGPADYIDPEYARLFYEAARAGVEIYPHTVLLTDKGYDLGPLLPLARCF